MKTTERRYDIDWLRVIAIGLLIMYHIGFVFLPWGVFIGFIQNDEPMDSLWNPMSMLNIWRIPLLFFVSGMGVCFAIGRKELETADPGENQENTCPLPLWDSLHCSPAPFCLAKVLQAGHLLIRSNPSHLWFLANIFIYVLVLSPLFFYLKKHANGEGKQVA